MRTGLRHPAWLALLPALAATPVLAQAPASGRLQIGGRVAHPQALTIAQLGRLPQASLTLTQVGAHGARQATYGGVLLRTLLDRATLVDEPGRKTHLRHVLMAHGTDGYVVALGLGEVDPDLEGKQVLVALTRDGQPMRSLELVVPGDRHAGRDVHDLDLITVD